MIEEDRAHPVTEDTWWTTYDRRRIRLRDLEDTHLANVIAWVSEHSHYPEELLVVLKKIAADRGLQPEFLARAEIPYRDQDGHWTLNFRRVG